jgi:hypothetical protein
MARVLEFFGSSDDNACWYDRVDGKQKHADEIGVYDRMARIRVSNEHAGLIVCMEYIDPGVWMVGVAQLEEDVGLPDWPFNISARGYTTVLEITVPPDVKVQDMDPKEEGD